MLLSVTGLGALPWPALAVTNAVSLPSVPMAVTMNPGTNRVYVVDGGDRAAPRVSGATARWPRHSPGGCPVREGPI